MPQSTRLRPRLLFAAVLAALFLLTPAATATLAPPAVIGPLDGTTVDRLPVFTWGAVAGADKYEWEIASDCGFNAPELGSTYGHFFTKNRRATVVKTVPNGSHCWHVRAVTSTGAVGDWSTPTTFVRDWGTAPTLSYPDDAATLVYPTDALKFTWQPVQGAWHYDISVATDPALGSVVWSGGQPIETQSTTFTSLDQLAPGTYYWGVTPLDPEGNPGTPSEVRSFTLSWPSTLANMQANDLVPDEEIDDYELSWDPVPGAVRYEIEVNPTVDFALGSRVCCYDNSGNPQYVLGTKFAPQVVLPNNHYYWRVRAIDPAGNPGDWTEGPEFTKTFDNVPPVTAPSVKNLHMRDNAGDPGVDSDSGTPQLDTGAPVVTWDAVPGASSYQVDVTPWGDAQTPGACDWSPPTSAEHWNSVVTGTSWTPMAGSWTGIKPYNSSVPVAFDLLKNLVTGHSYCIRVRAVDKASTLTGQPAYGDYTYLPGGPNDDGTPAFTFTGYPAGGACSPSCSPGYLGANDYLEPITGTTSTMTPLFTWNPVAGAQSYYVLVAKDPNFTTVIDYALTRDPAYSPRTFTQTRGYADETTLLYWAVLPATGVNGSGSTGDPLSAAPSNFQKQTVGPGLLSPTAGQDFWGPVTFQWSPAFSAQQYRLQVSQDPTFANPIETVVTDSTEYTSNTSYPADTVLYWRVRADAENGVGNPTTVGLTWSATGTFQKHLVTPTLDGDSSTPQIDPNPTQGTTVPTFEWDPVQSADSYDFKVQIPNGTSTGSTSQTFNIPTHAFSFGTMKGTGIWKWQVRAIFPGTTAFQTVAGPWTTLQNFVRTIPEPASATQAVAGSTVNFSWDPRQARVYHVQVSTRPDFGQLVENTTTDNTDYAPLLTQYNYQGGGTFYWRVAAADDTSMNLGDYTAAHTFTIGPPTAPTALKRFRLSVVGYPIRNRLRTVTIHVKNAATGGPVGAATVSVYGAGVLPKSKLSSPTGVASFSIKATKLGTVTWRVSKTSFVTKYLYQTVRAG